MSAADTWKAWLTACSKCGGAMNGIKTPAGGQYYLSSQPRVQANGAIVGRAYRFERGYGLRDIGLFKIAPGGAVVSCPAELAAVLPGCEDSKSGGSDDAQPSEPQQEKPRRDVEPDAE